MTKSLELTWPQAIGGRLARHHLLEPAPAARLVEVARDIGGVHAQVAASAELMLGIRTRKITRQDVRTALSERRTLVKTVGLRGTLHLFAAADVPLWMAANRLRQQAAERRLASQGTEMAELQRVVDVISTIVGPRPISRPDFERELATRIGGWALQRNQGWVGSTRNWTYALGWAAAQGIVCYGPADGGRISFVKLADWACWREVDPLEGGMFALRGFLHAYGPSTQAEFSRWFSSEPALTRRLFGALGEEVAAVAVEDERRFILRRDCEASWGAAPDAVHLLPHFDVFVVGSHPRERLFDPASAVGRITPGTVAPLAVVLVGGRVAGLWERRPKGKRLSVRVSDEIPFSRKQRAEVERQAERVAQVLELSCELEFGEVSPRRHL